MTRFHRHKCLDTRGFPPLGPLASFSPPSPSFRRNRRNCNPPPSPPPPPPSFPCLFPRTCDSCGVRPIHTGDDCVCARTRLVTLSFVNSTISRGRSFTRPRLFCPLPPPLPFPRRLFFSPLVIGGEEKKIVKHARETHEKKGRWRTAAGGEREENHHLPPAE